MKNSLLLSLVAFLAGCAPHNPVTVIGESGRNYTAPGFCSALIKCKHAEIHCYADSIYTKVPCKKTGASPVQIDDEREMITDVMHNHP